jgi:hypothetical protein
MIVPLPLVPAEFYHLHDYRGEAALEIAHEYDPDPEASAKAVREVAKRRLALNPSWAPNLRGPVIEITPDIAPTAA